MKKRMALWAVYLLIGAGIGAAYKHFSKNEALDGGVIAMSPDDKSATILKPQRSTPNESKVESSIGGEFQLVDHNGNDVTQADYDDAYKFVFFGFTYCPAVCPTELQKVTLIMDELGDDAASITPLFITVDPERDTVEQMKQYVEQFHPKLVGLTGSMEQTKAVAESFKVYASKVENEMMEEYMMDHSSYLYLMDKDNSLIAVYPATDTAMDIVADIQEREL